MEDEERRIRWRSRRGMLELELLLVPFAEQVYPRLPAAAQRQFRLLLECEDRDLYDWILQGAAAPPAHAAIVTRIIRHARAAAH